MIGASPNSTLFSLRSNEEKPQDTVSCLSWLPFSSNSFGQYSFGCSSWDSKIRIYCISEERKTIDHWDSLDTEHPCLSIAFQQNSPNFVAAGCIDNSVKYIDINRRQTTNIGHHDDAVKDVYWMDQNVVLSTSFDKTLRVWDIRDRNPQILPQLKFNYKITCSDLKGRLMALGFEGCRSIVFDFMNARPEVFSDERNYFPSPFEEPQEISSIALFHDLKGFSVGSTSGRADLSDLIEQPNTLISKRKIITFKCLKDDASGSNSGTTLNLYPVNVVAFNPASKYNMITAGGNGRLHFWDYQARLKNSTINTGGVPITKAIYSPDGKFVVYASGYDWSSGIEKSMLYKTDVTAHLIREEDLVKKRAAF